MKFKIEGRCVLTFEHTEGEEKSKHVSTDFNLEVGQNLKRELFLDMEDLPTAVGVKALTQCFVQGLVGNIHYAHNQDFWDSALHLRYIIAELERGFSTVANTTKSSF